MRKFFQTFSSRNEWKMINTQKCLNHTHRQNKYALCSEKSLNIKYLFMFWNEVELNRNTICALKGKLNPIFNVWCLKRKRIVNRLWLRNHNETSPTQSNWPAKWTCLNWEIRPYIFGLPYHKISTRWTVSNGIGRRCRYRRSLALTLSAACWNTLTLILKKIYELLAHEFLPDGETAICLFVTEFFFGDCSNLLLPSNRLVDISLLWSWFCHWLKKPSKCSLCLSIHNFRMQNFQVHTHIHRAKAHEHQDAIFFSAGACLLLAEYCMHFVTL